MNYTSLKSFVLRSMRGKRSQAQISRQLGYSFNQVYRWESGRTGVSWCEFLDFAEVCRVDVRAKLNDCFRFDRDSRNTTDLVNFLLGNARASVLAKQLQVSKFKLEKWRSGALVPRLEDVLMMVEYSSGLAVTLVEHFAGKTMPAKYLQSGQTSGAKGLIATYPMCAMIDLLFLDQEYQKLPRHVDGYVARKVGITIAQEKKILQAMEAQGLLQWQNEKYVFPTENFRIHTRTPNFADHKNIISYWLSRAMLILERQHVAGGFDDSVSLMSYKVFRVSEEGFKKINERYREFYHEIGRLIREDEGGPELLRAFAMQLFDPVLGPV